LTVELWRIGTDTPGYTAEDMSGKGAELTGGRWNEKGVPVVYTASSRALACLETVVHFNAGGLPLNRYLVRVEVPDAVWAKALAYDQASAPVGWDAEPPGRESIRLGTDWLKSIGSALLIVPSVIVPEEVNILINPLHPDSAAIGATKVRKWTYDARLVK
jgi:RES domain-containing protein